MRYLIVGIAARLGWLPTPTTCSCYEAVQESADAHARTLAELREARAENDRLRERLAETAALPAPRQEATT